MRRLVCILILLAISGLLVIIADHYALPARLEASDRHEHVIGIYTLEEIAWDTLSEEEQLEAMLADTTPPKRHRTFMLCYRDSDELGDDQIGFRYPNNFGLVVYERQGLLDWERRDLWGGSRTLFISASQNTDGDTVWVILSNKFIINLNGHWPDSNPNQPYVRKIELAEGVLKLISPMDEYREFRETHEKPDNVPEMP